MEVVHDGSGGFQRMMGIGLTSWKGDCLNFG